MIKVLLYNLNQMINFTIDSPDSVRRVTPPSDTAPNAIAAIPPIQYPTILGVFSWETSAIVVVHLFRSFLIKFVNFWKIDKENERGVLNFQN